MEVKYLVLTINTVYIFIYTHKCTSIQYCIHTHTHWCRSGCSCTICLMAGAWRVTGWGGWVHRGSAGPLTPLCVGVLDGWYVDNTLCWSDYALYGQIMQPGTAAVSVDDVTRSNRTSRKSRIALHKETLMPISRSFTRTLDGIMVLKADLYSRNSIQTCVLMVQVLLCHLWNWRPVY